MRTQVKQPLISTDEGYVPVPVDELYASLCNVTDILDQLDVPYTVSGGTLLGAVRQGDLFLGDSDWDLEIVDTDLNKILEAAELFSEKGLKAVFPHRHDANPLAKDGQIIENCERRILKIYDTDDRFHGDLFLHTLFSDGILRRVSLENGVYWNAKMAFPVWFLENRETVDIRGRPFACVHNPELNCSRIYGPNWRLPKTRHDRVTGYNFAGAHLNAKIESSIAYALEHGWVPRYPDSAPWPQKITHTSTKASARWIRRHEHLEANVDNTLPLDERNAIQLLKYRALITKLKRRTEKTKTIHQEALALSQVRAKKLAAAKVKMLAYRQQLAEEKARHSDELCAVETDHAAALAQLTKDHAALIADNQLQMDALKKKQAKLSSKLKAAATKVKRYERSIFLWPHRLLFRLKRRISNRG